MGAAGVSEVGRLDRQPWEHSLDCLAQRKVIWGRGRIIYLYIYTLGNARLACPTERDRLNKKGFGCSFNSIRCVVMSDRAVCRIPKPSR